MGRRLNRGDVCWVLFPAPDNRRPAVILTRDSALGYLGKITVAPITSTIRQLPSHVILTPEDDGVPEFSAVNLDGVITVQKHRIGSTITRLTYARMREVEVGLLFALGVDSRT